MDAALSLPLRIPEGKLIAQHAADETPAHDRAALITAKDARAFLDRVK
jgi:hypothetical protein